ncbi:MAG: hypothetical protein ACFFB5_06380 [Promethearchaeota archaeon]
MNLTDSDLLDIKDAANRIVKLIERGLGPKKEPIDFIPNEAWITVEDLRNKMKIDTKSIKEITNRLLDNGSIEINRSTLGRTGIVLKTKIKRFGKRSPRNDISFYAFVKSLQNIWLQNYKFGSRVNIKIIQMKLLQEIQWLDEELVNSFLKDLHMIYSKEVALEPALFTKEGLEISGEYYSKIVIRDKLV